MRRLLSFMWAAAFIAIGTLFVAFKVDHPSDDIDIFFEYGLIALSFPTGLAVFWIVGLVAIALFNCCEIEVYAAIQHGVLWVGCGLIGYAQWFIAIPRIVGLCHGQMKQNRDSPS